MQSLTEKTFRLAPPGGLFDDTVVRNLFPDASDGARKLLVHRAVSSGEIIRLKPGLYMLEQALRASEAHPFVVAAALHFPSHVSLQSALSFHGLILEAVYQVSSVTMDRSRTFATPLGTFTFQRVPMDIPRAGVRAVQISRDQWAFVATPVRAIADLVYLNRAISWKKDGLSFVTESMRIEMDDLRTVEMDTFNEVLRGARNGRVRGYLDGLKGALNDD